MVHSGGPIQQDRLVGGGSEGLPHRRNGAPGHTGDRGHREPRRLRCLEVDGTDHGDASRGPRNGHQGAPLSNRSRLSEARETRSRRAQQDRSLQPGDAELMTLKVLTSEHVSETKGAHLSTQRCSFECIKVLTHEHLFGTTSGYYFGCSSSLRSAGEMQTLRCATDSHFNGSARRARSLVLPIGFPLRAHLTCGGVA